MLKRWYCPNCEKVRWIKQVLGETWKCVWCGFRFWIEEKVNE